MTRHLKKISRYTPSVLQGTLQFEAGRPRFALAHEFSHERRIPSILSMSLVALIALYLYFVTASVFNVMARADALRQTRAVESSTAQLEQQYLSLSQAITPQAADSLGLTAISQTAYVYRPGNAAMAATGRNAI